MSKWIGMTIAPAVTGRSLLESPSTQVRSLEGRPLGMSSSLMLPESSRLSLLELGSSFVTALAEQRPTDNRPIVYTARAGIREPRDADRARPAPPCRFLAWPEVPATGRRENA
jgi:hypothetical protein